MNKRDLARKVATHRTELHHMGVSSLALFGSAARDEATSESDVDFLIEFNRPVSLFHLFKVQHRLEEILGFSRVDLVQRGALHPTLREHILAGAVNVA